MKQAGLLLSAFLAVNTGIAVSAPAEPTALQWLERMSHSHRELDFRGVVTYRTEDHSSSFKVVHRIVDGREFEYLEPLDERGRELVRSGHNPQCIHPADQIIRPDGDSPTGTSIEKHYRLRLDGESRVAGREGVVVLIRAADDHRLGYRMVLDADTALPLKVDIVDRQGNLLERFQYAMVEIGTVAQEPPPADAVEVSHPETLVFEQDPEALQKRDWRPEWVPPGFVLAQSGNGDDALSYTDGLAMFSVFLDRGGRNSSSMPPEAAMRRGATVAYSRTLSQEAVVTVVGEVPVATAKAIAESVRWSP